MLTVAFLFGLFQMTGAQELPDNWESTDIGNSTGSATYDSETGTFTLTGDGINFWDIDDAHFAYVQIDGDFEMEARIVTFQSETGLGGSAKAGINARNSLETDASSIMMAWEDWGGLATTARKAAAETPTWAGGTYPGAGAIPWYLKVTRVGDVFYTFESVDKADWVSVDTLEFSNMLSTIYVGLAISPNSEDVASATFDEINITGNILSPTGIKSSFQYIDSREVYPNPAYSTLYINLQQDETIQSLSIVDVKGSIVFESAELSLNKTLNVASLKPGLYFLNIVTDKAVTSSKFIKK